jgi:type I restriction enzyme R subunit
MTRITESAIEQLAIERLEALGYRYVYSPGIAFDGDTPERASYAEVLLTGRVRA